MSKKRFTYLNYSRDGYIGSFYLNDKPLTSKEVWDLLNEQDNRIRELERINNICEEQITELRRLVNIATNNDFIKKSKKEEWKKELMKE